MCLTVKNIAHTLNYVNIKIASALNLYCFILACALYMMPRMKKVEEAKMTVKEVAALLNAGESSVRMWCVEGKFPNAEYVQSPRGAYWMIPESDLKGFEKRDRGRPPKQKTNGASGKKGSKKR
jgi:hypothetical protein